MWNTLTHFVDVAAPFISLVRLGLSLFIAWHFICIKDGRAKRALVLVFLLLAWGSAMNLAMWCARRFEPIPEPDVRAVVYILSALTAVALGWLAWALRASARKGK